MPDYYAGAVGTITSSVHEGFNIPIIESLACGTPVIASDIKVHREFEGDGIYYFYPMSYVDLGDTLIRVLNNYERIAELTYRNSFKIKSEYSMKKIFSSYIDLYERTINDL
jgi:glycosyltransferase involved in cell wall biosynthesis